MKIYRELIIYTNEKDRGKKTFQSHRQSNGSHRSTTLNLLLFFSFLKYILHIEKVCDWNRKSVKSIDR